MSILILPNGEDFPAAAKKHLDDVTALIAATRFDGASYLVGYVVECCLKSLIVLELGSRNWGPREGHDFHWLSSEVRRLALISGSRSARYLSGPVSSILTASVATWMPSLRYRADGTSNAVTTNTWFTEAQNLFKATISEMILNGEA